MSKTSNRSSSLQKLKVFKNIYPVRQDAAGRQDIEALEAHFVDRLDDVLGACRDGATLRQIVDRMYFAMAQEQNVIKMIFPIKQTLAYLHYLEGEGAAGKKEGRWFAFRERL